MVDDLVKVLEANPYDPRWAAYVAAQPRRPRSLGAAVAAAAADAGDGGDKGETDKGAGDAKPGAGEGDQADDKAGDGKGEEGKTALTSGDGEAAGSDAAGGAKAAAADWRADLPDDLKKLAEKYTTPADVLKAYQGREKLISQSVKLPGKDASEKEMATFRKAMGIPETADGYEVKVPDDLPERFKGDDEAGQARQGEFLKVMHEAGASQAVVSGVLGWYYGELAAIAKAQDEADKESKGAAEAALRKDWGGDYERNIQYAKRAAGEFGDEDFVAFAENTEIDGTKLGDHPAFLKAFASIGRRMNEDLPLIGSGTDAATNAQDRINELHELQSTDPAKYRSKAVQQELQELYGKLHGHEPVVGQDGRTV